MKSRNKTTTPIKYTSKTLVVYDIKTFNLREDLDPNGKIPEGCTVAKYGTWASRRSRNKSKKNKPAVKKSATQLKIPSKKNKAFDVVSINYSFEDGTSGKTFVKVESLVGSPNNNLIQGKKIEKELRLNILNRSLVVINKSVISKKRKCSPSSISYYKLNDLAEEERKKYIITTYQQVSHYNRSLNQKTLRPPLEVTEFDYIQYKDMNTIDNSIVDEIIPEENNSNQLQTNIENKIEFLRKDHAEEEVNVNNNNVIHENKNENESEREEFEEQVLQETSDVILDFENNSSDDDFELMQALDKILPRQSRSKNDNGSSEERNVNNNNVIHENKNEKESGRENLDNHFQDFDVSSYYGEIFEPTQTINNSNINSINKKDNNVKKRKIDKLSNDIKTDDYLKSNNLLSTSHSTEIQPNTMGYGTEREKHVSVSDQVPSEKIEAEVNNISEQNVEVIDKETHELKSKGPIVRLIDEKFVQSRIKNITTTYDIHDKKDLEKLCRDTNYSFKYNENFNKKRTKIKLIIAPVAELGNELGVFADEFIPYNSESPIAYYGGVRTKIENESEEDKKSDYRFEIYDKRKVIKNVEGEFVEGEEEYVSEVINPKTEGDFTRFFNHSEKPNLRAEEIIDENGVKQIAFFPCRDIQPGDQLLFNYGIKFFKSNDDNDVEMQPRYLDKDSNSLSPQLTYQENKEAYAEGIYEITDKNLIEDLRLPSPYVLLPKFILTMLTDSNHDNLEKFKDMLKSYKADLPILSVIDGEICDVDKHQKITALQLACYQGDYKTYNAESYIKTLLESGAYPDHGTLQDGYTPLMLLLSGQGNNKFVEKMALDLLNDERVFYAFTEDKNELGILHYAIVRNNPIILQRIFELIDNKDVIFARLIRNENETKYDCHYTFDDCMLYDQFEILKVYLKNMDTKFLEEMIKSKMIFHPVTLAGLSEKSLEKLHDTLTQSSHAESLKNVLLEIKKLQKPKNKDAFFQSVKKVNPPNIRYKRKFN